MRGIRSILADRGCAHAVLALAVLLLLLQTAISGAMGVAQAAIAVGDEPQLVICSPLSPEGVIEIPGAGESAADFHCPLCRVTNGAPLPPALDGVDLGPAFSLELADASPTLVDEALMPKLLVLELAPDRTGPPTERA